MTNKSRPAHLVGLRPDLTTIGLSPQQRALLDLMRVNRFGRVENMNVRGGQPVLDHGVRIVRVARLGGENDRPENSGRDEFELKKEVRDLFDELARLDHGTILKLEFRHALPLLLETAAAPTSDGVNIDPGDERSSKPKENSV